MTGAMNWALKVEVGPAAKLVLVGLAWISGEDGATVKSQKTLAERFDKDDRWVRGHLATLAKAGLITRFRRHRMNGSRTSDLIVLAIPREEPLDLSIYDGLIGGRIDGPEVNPTGGNPPGGLPAETRRPTGGNPPDQEGPSGGTASHVPSPGANASAEIPDGFPDELRPHARRVMELLREQAKLTPRAKVISTRSVGLTIMANPRKGLVEECYAYVGWITDKPGRHTDLIQGYRNWLKDKPILASVEVLPEEQQATVMGNVRRFPAGGRRTTEEQALRDKQATMLGQMADERARRAQEERDHDAG